MMSVIAKPVSDAPEAVGSPLDEGPVLTEQRTPISRGLMAAFDAVDGAHSAASRCHRVVSLEQTTLRGAVHG